MYEKQMRTIMYTRALFILHKNRRTLTFSRRHRKRNFLFTLKRKSFPDLENAEHLDHCPFYTQTENLVLSYSTLTILLFSCHLYSPCFRMILLNQLMQQCTARTAWSDSNKLNYRIGPKRSYSVIKLVSVLFGKCTTLVITKC